MTKRVIDQKQWADSIKKISISVSYDLSKNK